MSELGVTICLDCAARCVVYGYEKGYRFPVLERSLPVLFQISRTTEEEILNMRGAELAAQYQSQLLAAREPAPTPDEGKKTNLSVTVTLYTKRKIDALAAEAGISSSEWIRHAIWLAFESTKA